MVKKIVALDKEGQLIVIQGSAAEPYQATLQECTCADFAIRQAPCKHMYCLAMELGLLDGLPVYDKRSASYDPDSELKRYRSLYERSDQRGCICESLQRACEIEEIKNRPVLRTPGDLFFLAEAVNSTNKFYSVSDNPQGFIFYTLFWEVRR